MNKSFTLTKYRNVSPKGYIINIFDINCKDGRYLQIVTKDKSFVIKEPDKSILSNSGIKLNINSMDYNFKCELYFTKSVALEKQPISFFEKLPLQCKLKVNSLHYEITGNVTIDGKKHCFDGGVGYSHTVSGKTYPKGFLWLQCNDALENDNSVVVALSHFPLGITSTTVGFAVVLANGTQYMMSTLNGAKLLAYGESLINIKCGKDELIITPLENSNYQTYLVPHGNELTRSIKECVNMSAHILFTHKDEVIIDNVSNTMSFSCLHH